MNLSMRDKKILLMFLGVLLFALSFLFVYKPQMEEAAQISANNGSFKEDLTQLLVEKAQRPCRQESMETGSSFHILSVQRTELSWL